MLLLAESPTFRSSKAKFIAHCSKGRQCVSSVSEGKSQKWDIYEFFGSRPKVGVSVQGCDWDWAKFGI